MFSRKVNKIIVGLFVISFFSCTSEKKENLDCSTLRIGEFEYRGGVSDRTITITRNDSIQFEKDMNTGGSIRLAIKWKGSCEYELLPLSASYDGRDTAFDKSSSEKMAMQTTIEKITRNYYICKTVNPGMGTTRLDTMLIMYQGDDSK